MGEYINKYANSAAIQAAVDGGELLKPYVALDESTGLIDWNSKSETDWSTVPLTFEILSDGNIKWYNQTGIDAKTIEYSKNGGEWTSITASSNLSLSVVSGDIIQFRGDNEQYGDGNSALISSFSGSTAQFNVKGNIMSLINSTNFSGLTTLTKQYALGYLFQYCTGLTDASNLMLPATTLYKACYCNMFIGCSNLTTAPVLPATTLAPSCYERMFQNCTSLNYIKCLATSLNGTSYWVLGVSSTGTFVTPSSTNWSTGINGIPTNWTRVDA